MTKSCNSHPSCNLKFCGSLRECVCNTRSMLQQFAASAKGDPRLQPVCLLMSILRTVTVVRASWLDNRSAD